MKRGCRESSENKNEENSKTPNKEEKKEFHIEEKKEEEKVSENENPTMLNGDGYFNEEELQHYKKIYANEKVEPCPRGKIKWNCGKILGTGSFGTVMYGFNTETGQVMAVKQVPIGGANFKERIQELEQEISILSQLKHKNIVPYLGTSQDKNYLYIFLQYEAGGSIAELLRKFGIFKEQLIRIYTRQILEGLEYLHSHNVIHRDIKGGNVLVDSNGVCKLADFGGAKRIYERTFKATSLKGTPYWMAPEVIKQTGYGRKADIWSVGCTVIEMATGKPPWSQYDNHFTALFYIGNSNKPPPFPPGLSPAAYDFLEQSFRTDPKERSNVCKLLNHAFITNSDGFLLPPPIPEASCDENEEADLSQIHADIVE